MQTGMHAKGALIPFKWQRSKRSYNEPSN